MQLRHSTVVTRQETCQVIEIYRRKTVFSPRKNEFDIHSFTGVFSFLAIFMCKHAEAYQTTPQAIGKR